jgi:hypothetical protein
LYLGSWKGKFCSPGNQILISRHISKHWISRCLKTTKSISLLRGICNSWHY